MTYPDPVDPIDRTPSPTFPEGLGLTPSALLDELEEECCAPESALYVVSSQGELQRLFGQTMFGAGHELLIPCLDGSQLVILRHVMHAPRVSGVVVRGGRTVHDPQDTGLQPHDLLAASELFTHLTPLPSLKAVAEQVINGLPQRPLPPPLPLALPMYSL